MQPFQTVHFCFKLHIIKIYSIAGPQETSHSNFSGPEVLPPEYKAYLLITNDLRMFAANEKVFKLIY